MENQVIISDYTQMDRALKEERTYILELCKQIKKAGCNVLLIQKSILRLVRCFIFVIAGCIKVRNIYFSKCAENLVFFFS